MSSIVRTVRLMRANWLVLVVVALMVFSACVAGWIVHLEEQKGVGQEQSASDAGERVRPSKLAITASQSDQAGGEEAGGEEPARQRPDVVSAGRGDGAVRPVERASLRLAAWSAWVGIFVGLVASIIALAQITAQGDRRRGTVVGRACVVCEAVNRNTGELAISLVNVGVGPVVFGETSIADETGRDLICLPGLVVEPSTAAELIVFAPLAIRPDRLELNAAFDGGGAMEATLRKEVATRGYVLIRQLEVHQRG